MEKEMAFGGGEWRSVVSRGEIIIVWHFKLLQYRVMGWVGGGYMLSHG